MSADGRPATTLLPDPHVSRLHARLDVEDTEYVLRDLGSRNGTRVGGTRILQACLDDGALIELGATKIRFRILDEPFEIPLAADNAFEGLLGRSVAMRELCARGAERGGGDRRGRDRHRQGARGPRDSPAVAAQRASRWSCSIARRSRRRWSRASCSATRRVRSPARSRRGPACSSARMAARCFSTSSASCRYKLRG